MKNQMKQQAICSFMLCYFLLFVYNANAQTKECISPTCTDQQGFIQYPSNNKLWIISKESQQNTTITLYLKEIALTTQTAWLRISVFSTQQPFRQNYLISNAEERFYAFQATAVSVELLVGQEPVIVKKFKITYFVGCPVIRSRSVSVVQKSSASFHQTCWIIIPILDQIPFSRLQIAWLQSFYGARFPISFFQMQRLVLETYLTIQNVTGINGSDIAIKNLVTGETLTTVEEDEILTSVTSEKTNAIVNIFNTDYSSIFLINLRCKNVAPCQEPSFALTSYGLGQRDVNCIEEQRCINELGSNCTRNSAATAIRNASNDDELVETTCTAFNIITNDFKRALNFDDDNDDDDDDDYIAPRLLSTQRGGGKRLLRRIKKCNKHTTLFCTEGCHHKKVKESKCIRICSYYRKIQRGCSPSGDGPVFA